MSTPSTIDVEAVRPAALSSADAAQYLGVSAGHLRNMRSRGEGPYYRKLSASPKAAVIYLIDDLDAWLAGLTRVGGAKVAVA